jgi:hypothetical protein
MVSKELPARARKTMALIPNQPSRKGSVSYWTKFQIEHDFESAIVDQLASGHKKAFVKAFKSSRHTTRLPHWFYILYHAAAAGYLHGKKSERVGGRLPKRLILAAKKKSGIQSQSELLQYALSKVALEDDYGKKLLSLKGSVPDDVEF